MFTIVHDAARPFEVEAGGATMRDLGTVFNVVAGARRVEVGVAEGAVLFDPSGAAVNLTPGMTLAPRRRGATAWCRGSSRRRWAAGGRGGSAIAPPRVDEVAADLARNLGVPVIGEPGGGGADFHGGDHPGFECGDGAAPGRFGIGGQRQPIGGRLDTDGGESWNALAEIILLRPSPVRDVGRRGFRAANARSCPADGSATRSSRSGGRRESASASPIRRWPAGACRRCAGG